MPINKVVYGNNTLIDLTNDSVSADKMLVGTIAHNKSGEIVEGAIENYSGSYSGSGSIGSGRKTIKDLLDLTKSCQYLFYNCTDITDVTDYISYNDTENILYTQFMFYNCNNLTSIPRIDTSKTTNMKGMFFNNYKLKKIDITHYNISNESGGGSWCESCHSLKAIIIRSFGVNYNLSAFAFDNCYHLEGVSNATYNPTGAKDGFIYVPRNMCDTLKSATNWSSYADQIRALEDYTVDGTTTGEFDDTKAGL